ncbi:MAG TPA: 3-phosphoshikimate 1-carboxyvinyltransferase, partial [Bacteroidales bacterium]|nr:3-phosphoshikimate 1-carboxyvinyltransferase [Bacteroidales bacterium]
MIKELKFKKVDGDVNIPSSKSYAHRALIALSLSKGKGTVFNVDLSSDIMATLKCLEDLGVDFFIKEKDIFIDATCFGDRRDRVLKPEESGSTLRFFIPITLLFDEVYEIRGSTNLMQRPLTVYEELFKDLDIMIYRDSLESIVLKGKLEPGDFSVRGDVSSQFISGMLIVLPLLSGDSTLTVTGDFQSRSYVDMTVKVMEDFGIDIRRENDTFFVGGNQEYKERDYQVEGDYSQGAYFLAAGVLAGNTRVHGLLHSSIQGDREIIRILERMGAGTSTIEDGYEASKSEIRAIEIDVSETPDLAPILGVLLSLSDGQGKLLNCDRLRYKESDRIRSTVDLVNSLGG